MGGQGSGVLAALARRTLCERKDFVAAVDLGARRRQRTGHDLLCEMIPGARTEPTIFP